MLHKSVEYLTMEFIHKTHTHTHTQAHAHSHPGTHTHTHCHKLLFLCLCSLSLSLSLSQSLKSEEDGVQEGGEGGGSLEKEAESQMCDDLETSQHNTLVHTLYYTTLHNTQVHTIAIWPNTTQYNNTTQHRHTIEDGTTQNNEHVLNKTRQQQHNNNIFNTKHFNQTTK